MLIFARFSASCNKKPDETPRIFNARRFVQQTTAAVFGAGIGNQRKEAAGLFLFSRLAKNVHLENYLDDRL